MAARGDIDMNKVQPNLPAFWKKINFTEGLDKSGKFTKLKSKNCLQEGKYPVVDQGEKLISAYINDADLLYKGETPIILFGDHTRNVKYIDFEFAVGADGTKILKPIPQFENKFFYYYLSSLAIPSLGYSRHYKILKEVQLPLPPIPEQKRIVQKLDALFDGMKRLQVLLAKVPQLVKDFRQSVLIQAVTGKLTEEWRQGKELEEWEIQKLNEVSILITKGASPKWQGVKYVNSYNKDSIFFITSENIGKFKIIKSKFKYIEIIFNEKQKRSILHENDVLTNIVGASIGRSATWKYKHRANINQAVCLIRPNPNLCNPEFITIFLNSNIGLHKLFANVVDVARANVSLGTIKKIEIKLPSLQEQTEIVRQVEQLFQLADRLEEQYHALKAKVDVLPQAVLSKAFRGELVEQLDTDGDAGELLEEIRKVREAMKGKRKVSRRRKI